MPPSSLSGRPLLALLLAAGCAGTQAPGGPSAPAPARTYAESLAEQGLTFLARDDGASLERAADFFQAALREDPKLYQARAHQALGDVLVAAARREEGARLASAQGEALMQSGRELRERALDALRPLAGEHGGDPAVVRALAVYSGLEGDAWQTAKVVAQARARGSDPWIDFAELAAELRSGSPDAAIPRLEAFAASHPGLLRARMMLARAQLDRSRKEETLDTLDEIIAANPRHELALRMKARLLAPPPPGSMAAVPAPQVAPPPQKPGNLPRKRSSVSAPTSASGGPRP